MGMSNRKYWNIEGVDRDNQFRFVGNIAAFVFLVGTYLVIGLYVFVAMWFLASIAGFI